MANNILVANFLDNTSTFKDKSLLSGKSFKYGSKRSTSHETKYFDNGVFFSKLPSFDVWQDNVDQKVNYLQREGRLKYEFIYTEKGSVCVSKH